MAKVLEAHGSKLGPAMDEDFEAFADDFDEDPLDAETLEFSIGLLGRELSEHGDSPSEAPDDDGHHHRLKRRAEPVLLDGAGQHRR